MTNTAVQIEIFTALGAAAPIFAHHPLLVGSGGFGSRPSGWAPLSAPPVARGGDRGPSAALASYLAQIGTSDPVENRASRSTNLPPIFVRQNRPMRPRISISAWNSMASYTKLLHMLPFRARGPEAQGLLGIPANAATWTAVKPNLTRLSDAPELWRLVAGTELIR